MQINKVQNSNNINFGSLYMQHRKSSVYQLKSIWHREWVLNQPITSLYRMLIEHIKQWKVNSDFAGTISHKFNKYL